MTEGVDHQRLNCLFLLDVGVVGLNKGGKKKKCVLVCAHVCVCVCVVDRAPNFTCSTELRRVVGQG